VGAKVAASPGVWNATLRLLALSVKLFSMHHAELQESFPRRCPANYHGNS